MRKALLAPLLAAAGFLGCGGIAHAQLQIGVNLSSTGAGASQGMPQRNLVEILPKTIKGLSVTYTVLDNATDPTVALRNARKLTAENNVDAMISGSTTPTALAAAEAAFETKTPMLSLAPLALAADRGGWVFVMPQPADLMIEAVAEHMKANGVKTVGYIGFADAWGDIVYKALDVAAKKNGLTIVNNERYQRTDQSAAAQALKTTVLKPDAVLIGAAGTPTVTPQLALLERGYTGKIYHTHGAVNNDVLRVGGKQLEGALAPIGPVVVAKDLPANDPVRKVSTDFIELYEKAYGPGPVNAFATWAYDAYLLLGRAVEVAVQKAKPGTPEFRLALRDAIEKNTGNTVARTASTTSRRPTTRAWTTGRA
jgi:branched-chain amino acid transport system substrate-binding protein